MLLGYIAEFISEIREKTDPIQNTIISNIMQTILKMFAEQKKNIINKTSKIIVEESQKNNKESIKYDCKWKDITKGMSCA